MKVLLLNQCFWPDVAATARQLTMLARRLSECGHEVTVITGRRGYDDPNQVFPPRQSLPGIQIVRIPSLRLGKGSRWGRALVFGSYLLACAARLLIAPRHDAVIALTSPPLISWVGSVFVRLKGGKLFFWSMDLNPDEAIAAGWLRKDSLTARLLSRLLMSSMIHAESIVALDRFMKEHITAKGIDERKIEVIPPASDDGACFDHKGREEFRQQHHLDDKFVVMYAGNHSPCNPLDTLLEAAERLQTRAEILFLFVGGGTGLSQVKQFAASRRLTNIRWLPYQPHERLSALLSAADLHVVVMGEAFKGILHPSKIYNILAVGSPCLFIGPDECHVTDLMRAREMNTAAICARHGEADKVARLVSDVAARPGSRVRPIIPAANEFSGDAIYSRFIKLIEYAGRSAKEPAPLEATARPSAG